MTQRTVYVPENLWRPLKAKLAMEGLSVSAWVREQARRYVLNGSDKGEALERVASPFFVPEQENG